MRKHLLVSILLLAAIMLITYTYGQNTITFTFNGVNNTSYLQLDSIKVKNLSQGTDTLLYYPDNTLVINLVGIIEKIEYPADFKVVQNFPNPVKDKTTIKMDVQERENFGLSVSNLLGQQIICYEMTLEAGSHSFEFTPGREDIYFFTARGKGVNSTIKILILGSGYAETCSLKYLGREEYSPSFKTTTYTQEFLFNPGDELMLIGFGGGLESGVHDTPDSSQDYLFQFATNIPCPGTDSIFYDGQWYHTIQVFSQCWMKENLNAGIMINSTQAQTNNDLIEKYCMGDDEYYCNITGGLYFWNEMMSYLYENEGQGICPEGWHIPGDLDWQILEGAVDDAVGIGDPSWGINGWRGLDAGGNLKETGTSNWVSPNTGATDAFGFTALPGGYFVQNAFWGIGYKTYLWSSDPLQKYYRNMDWNQSMIQRNTGGGSAAFSVRCIMD